MKRVSFRHVVLALIGLQGLASLLGLLALIGQPFNLLGFASAIISAVAMLVFFVAYWRGYEWARAGTVIVTTLLNALIATQEPYLTQVPTLTVFIPPVLALVMTGPFWVLGVGVLQLVILLVRAQGGVYVDPFFLIIYGLVIGGMALSRVLTDMAQRAAEDNARRASEALGQSERQAHELAQKALELEQQNTQQQQLLALVNTLETPVVMLADGVLFAPVVGHLDTRRAQELTSRLLHAANTQRARLMVIDIAGVAAVDTSVARALVEAARALRLLGCSVTISGISAAVAATLTHLGVALDGISTTRSPQDALTQYSGWQKVTSN
jgi:anti-anti-sigma regulatory factor